MRETTAGWSDVCLRRSLPGCLHSLHHVRQSRDLLYPHNGSWLARQAVGSLPPQFISPTLLTAGDAYGGLQVRTGRLSGASLQPGRCWHDRATGRGVHGSRPWTARGRRQVHPRQRHRALAWVWPSAGATSAFSCVEETPPRDRETRTDGRFSSACRNLIEARTQ